MGQLLLQSFNRLTKAFDAFAKLVGGHSIVGHQGIKGFSKAIETLEQQLAHRLAEVEGGSAFGHAVQEIFLLNDFNGDGCITRDEWLGSDAVFDALDQDHDGRLTPDDVRLGFGAALALSTV